MLDQSSLDPQKDYKSRLVNFSNEFDLGLFLYIFKRSLAWLLAGIVVSALLAFLYLRYSQVVYEARSVVQITESDNSTRVINMDVSSEENGVEAKMEQMRSKLLISRTIQQLPLRVSYFAEGQVLSNEHYQYSPYKIELIELISPDVQDSKIQIVFTSPGQYELEYGGNKYSNLMVNQEVQTPDFKIKTIVENWEELVASMSDYALYFRINSMNALVNRFYQNLEVRILNKTAKTVELSFRDNNPFIARDFVRAHANEFIAFDLEKRKKSDQSVLDYLNEQIDTVFVRLKESESDLNSYKQRNKINDLEVVSEHYFDRMSSFENDLVNIDMEQGLLEEVKKLTKKNTTEIEVYNLLPLIAGSRYEAALSKQLDKLYILLSDKEEALYSVTPASDQIKSLDYQIGVQKELILQSIDALKGQLMARKQNLSGKLNQAEGDYYTIPAKELEFARLRRLFQINEKYYTLLLEKAIEYQISKEGFVSNNQILEEARVPSAPLYPKRQMVWVTFLLAGLLLGLIVITIRYLLHNKITSLHEVNKVANASISTLGVIPRMKEDIPNSMVLVHKNPRSLLSESFRSIRTNLQFIKNTEGPKLITITSTIAGEGKTFVALNLAGIIAYSGKRVIVCDLDMRKPKIHKGFQTENQEGMSTLLIGRSSLDKTIRKSELENLDFITAGPIPPNPSELIIGEPMQHLLEELKKKYDVIILDTPPVGLVTDGILLMKQADYPLYVFRADYSKKQFIQVADRLINENEIQLSVVLNAVDMDRNKYSDRYSYGYGYGYGYGYSAAGYFEGQTKPIPFWKTIFSRKS
jgi:tyrosine-protein kinase Etk/Wzc